MPATPLHQAAFNGNLPRVRELLREGADPDALSFGFTPLHLAAMAGHEDCVRELSGVCDIHIHTPLLSGTALTLAATYGRAECAEVLMARLREDMEQYMANINRMTILMDDPVMAKNMDLKLKSQIDILAVSVNELKAQLVRAEAAVNAIEVQNMEIAKKTVLHNM